MPHDATAAPVLTRFRTAVSNLYADRLAVRQIPRHHAGGNAGRDHPPQAVHCGRISGFGDRAANRCTCLHRRIRAMIEDAETFIARLPSDAVGVIFLDGDKPVQPDPGALDRYQRKPGAPPGLWPSSPEITRAMLERYGKPILWPHRPRNRPQQSPSLRRHRSRPVPRHLPRIRMYHLPSAAYLSTPSHRIASAGGQSHPVARGSGKGKPISPPITLPATPGRGRVPVS